MSLKQPLLTFKLLLLTGSFAPLLAWAEESQDTAKEIATSSGVRISMQDGQVESWLIPTVLFLTIFGTVAVVHYFRHRRNQEVQQTIRTMIEKGVSVPPELLVQPEPRKRHSSETDLRRGLMFTFLGVAIPVAMLISQPEEQQWAWGFIPLALGAAYLVSAKFAKPKA